MRAKAFVFLFIYPLYIHFSAKFNFKNPAKVNHLFGLTKLDLSKILNSLFFTVFLFFSKKTSYFVWLYQQLSFANCGR